MSAPPVRLGVVGYGTGGQHFHTPFIEAAEGIELAGVVTRSPERQSLVAREWPGVATYDSLGALLDAGVDAVTITTPPETRRELVLEAVAAGVHVVADKPFAPTAAVGAELVAAAEAAGVLLTVFHNRRWDADIRTLAGVLDSGELGELWRVHSRFDLDDPATLEAGPTGGLLRDLGSHVVDQMVWLLGPVRAVSAHLDQVELPQGRTDAGFVVDLRHESGVFSVVESSKLNRLAVRELRAYGSSGSFTWTGSDVQAQAVFAGRKPADDLDDWGYDDHRGQLSTERGRTEVASAQGRYHDFYTQFAAAVRGDGSVPVMAASAVATLAVLDAARESAASGLVVEVATSAR